MLLITVDWCKQHFRALDHPLQGLLVRATLGVLHVVDIVNIVQWDLLDKEKGIVPKMVRPVQLTESHEGGGGL